MTISVCVGVATLMPLGICCTTGCPRDRKSTRLNSSHSQISYAVFCLKKKKKASCKDGARTSWSFDHLKLRLRSIRLTWLYDTRIHRSSACVTPSASPTRQTLVVSVTVVH